MTPLDRKAVRERYDRLRPSSPNEHDDERECPRCHCFPSPSIDHEPADHDLCWPCSSDTVSELLRDLRLALDEVDVADAHIARLEARVDREVAARRKWRRRAVDAGYQLRCIACATAVVVTAEGAPVRHTPECPWHRPVEEEKK